MRSTNPRDVGLIFRDYARKIHAKAVPSDPNFIRLSIACGKVHFPYPHLQFSHSPPFLQIEQWCEQNYPSFIQPPSGTFGNEPTLDPTDARTRIANLESEFAGELAGRKRMVDHANGDRNLAMSRINAAKANGKFSSQKTASQDVSMGTMLLYVGAAFALLIAVGFGAAYGLIWITGESLTGSATAQA